MTNNQSKTCTKCGAEKPLSEFNKRKSTRSGYRSTCRECGREIEAKLSSVKRENTPQGQEKKCSKCLESKPVSDFAFGNATYGRQSQCRACNYANGLSKRSKTRKAAYSRERNTGFSKGEFEKAVEVQGRLCAICQDDLSNISAKHVHADHNHVNGEKRGVLCGQCNRALGLFNDSAILLRRAAEYLENPPLRGVL